MMMMMLMMMMMMMMTTMEMMMVMMMMVMMMMVMMMMIMMMTMARDDNSTEWPWLSRASLTLANSSSARRASRKVQQCLEQGGCAKLLCSRVHSQLQHVHICLFCVFVWVNNNVCVASVGLHASASMTYRKSATRLA